MESQIPSAYLPSVFEQENATAFEVDQAAAYFLAPSSQHFSTNNQNSVNQNDTEYPIHYPGRWLGTDTQFRNNLSHHSYQPASSRSSQSSGSNCRSSNNTTFSQWHLRDSIASTNTTWSNFSESSKDHYITQAERSLSAHSSVSYPQIAEPLEKPTPELQPRCMSQRQTFQDKELYSTCVSKAERSRRSNKEPNYWCTSCKKGFGEKYDWKRHEETFQERSEMYECGLCNKSYFLDKDFIHHHQKGHRCKTCVENRHVAIAKRKRVARTGWGCGFCLRFDRDWTERCKHIAWHFEKGDSMANWKHSKVIFSLLQQPLVQTEWIRLIEEKQERDPSFGWNQTDTGRAEGFPDNNRAPQLQDLLEFFTPNQNASTLVQLAYEKGHRKQHKTSRSPEQLHWIPETSVQHSSPPRRHEFDSSANLLQQLGPNTPFKATGTARSPAREKELPPVPSGLPVLQKDYRNRSMHATSNMPNSMVNFESWNNLTNTIPEDDVLPDAVSMDIYNLNFETFDSRYSS